MTEQEQRLTTEDIASRPAQDDQPVGRERAPADEAGTGARAPEARADEGPREEPLLPPADLENYQQRWESVQGQFVDEPRAAVEEADALVAELMRQLADTFASERSTLEQQWDRGGEADTETLRVTLQRYRNFFNRLLAA